MPQVCTEYCTILYYYLQSVSLHIIEMNRTYLKRTVPLLWCIAEGFECSRIVLCRLPWSLQLCVFKNKHQKDSYIISVFLSGVWKILAENVKTRCHSCRETNDVSTIVFIIMILISTPQSSVHINLIAGHHIHNDSKRKQWRRTSSCSELPNISNRSW